MQGNDKTIINKTFIIAIFVLESLVFSSQNDIMFSKTAITVDNDAKIINKKKIVPIILPPGICVNILVKVVNKNDAPKFPTSATVCPPLKVNAAGKIIKPDINATVVSKLTMVTASPSNLFSFLI